MLSRLTHAHFEPCLNQVFQAHGEHADPPQSLELVEVNVIGEPIPGVTTRHAFSLIFRGPGDRMLRQATYRFENDTIGPLEFTIVPIGPDAKGLRYEAIFS